MSALGAGNRGGGGGGDANVAAPSLPFINSNCSLSRRECVVCKKAIAAVGRAPCTPSPTKYTRTHAVADFLYAD